MIEELRKRIKREAGNLKLVGWFDALTVMVDSLEEQECEVARYKGRWELAEAELAKKKGARDCVADIKQIFATYMLNGGDLENPIHARLAKYNDEVEFAE